MKCELGDSFKDIEEIIEDIKVAVPGIEEILGEEDIQKLAMMIQSKHRELVGEQDNRFITIKKGSKHYKVILRNIIFAETFERKIILHTKDSVLEYNGKIGDLEKILGSQFFRSHRAYIVNIDYVTSFDADTIWVTGGKAIMSKAKHSEFVNLMKSLSEDKE